MKKLKKPCIRKIEVYVRLYGGGATNEGCNCCSWQYKKEETYIMKKLIKPMKKNERKVRLYVTNEGCNCCSWQYLNKK